MRLATLFAFALLAVDAAAADDRFERILLPLVVQQHPGAYGTLWTTRVVIRNEADVPAEIFHSECYFRCIPNDRCLTPMCLSSGPTPGHSAYRGPLGRNAIGTVANPGAILYVQSDLAQLIVAQTRLIEESRKATDAGVEIPVVRPYEQFTDTLWLADVPASANTRTHLRLYGIESPDGQARLRVRVYPAGGGDATFDAAVDLMLPTTSGATPLPGQYDEPQPAFGILLLPPELAAGGDAVRVRVDPLTGGLRFWAMASVTSNATQNVTLVTPQ